MKIKIKLIKICGLKQKQCFKGKFIALKGTLEKKDLKPVT